MILLFWISIDIQRSSTFFITTPTTHHLHLPCGGPEDLPRKQGYCLSYTNPFVKKVDTFCSSDAWLMMPDTALPVERACHHFCCRSLLQILRRPFKAPRTFFGHTKATPFFWKAARLEILVAGDSRHNSSQQTSGQQNESHGTIARRIDDDLFFT